MDASRRDFLAACASLGLGGLMPGALWGQAAERGQIDAAAVEGAERIAGLRFTPEQREAIARAFRLQMSPSIAGLHAAGLANETPPALVFMPAGVSPARAGRVSPMPLGRGRRPESTTDLAFAGVRELAGLIRRKEVSARELMELALSRMAAMNDRLLAVATVTEARARRMATQLDEEASRGRFRGPLHGIPWGVKDLMAVAGYPTEWGSAAHRGQRIEKDAEVVRRLDAAGAVLVAKLSVGELAMGDVWHGGRTNNPWNPATGSSGSSAGSASAVAAGLMPFALGTETLGSISSPCARCGATGLRPTFGLVPRTGTMALVWSMDKIGPIARRVDDLAFVLAAIAGPDGRDRASRSSATWAWRERTTSLSDLRIGVLREEFDARAKSPAGEADARMLEALERQGARLQPVRLPKHDYHELAPILFAEAAASFDELTRSGRDAELKQQGPMAWPALFRMARFVSAVDYVNANRLRTLLMERWEEFMSDLDAVICPTGGNQLLATNLTGHPAVILPHGFEPTSASDPTPTPTSITVLGRLWGEGPALRVAGAIEAVAGMLVRRPPG